MLRDGPRHRDRWTRHGVSLRRAAIAWGLPGISVLLAVALLATAASGYVGARRTADEVAQALALGAALSVRQSLRGGGEIDDARLQGVLDELEPEGLRYVALVNPAGTELAIAGDPLNQARAALVGEPGVATRIDGSARLSVRLPLADGVGFGGRGRGRGLAPRGWGRAALVIEHENVAAPALARRAEATLWLASCAALVLLGVAGGLIRLSLRERTAAERRERDERLRTLGEMSVVLGHELRNPLTSLKGHAQLLLEGLPPDAAAREDAGVILGEAIRLEALADQVLEFARTGELDFGDEDPAAIARAAAERLAPARIELAVAGDGSRWSLDARRLELALVNLLRNAVQASPAELPVQLSVTARRGETLAFEVRDQGPGLPAGAEAHVLEPYFTTRVRGVGLGLSIARRIVEGHGGRLQAENAAGGGARFRVVIPAARAAKPSEISS